MHIVYHHRTRAADAQGIHIAEMIRAFESLGHTVAMAALVQGTDATKSENTKTPRWKQIAANLPGAGELLQFGYNAVGLPLLLKTIKQRRPDFLYERYSLFNASGVLAAQAHNIPLVLEMNSPLADEMHAEGAIRFHGLARWTERTIANAAHTVIAVSTALKQILVQQGIDAHRILVMPNGIDPAKFHPQSPDAQLRQELGIHGRTVIGFIGWFRPWHGLDMLVDAFRQAQLQNAVLLLVGDGPALPAIRAFVDQHQLQQQVIFAAAQPHHQITRYASLFDVAVQPAANEYCCPMKIIEYFGLGKPVIAPDQPNIVELLTPGTDSILFQPRTAASLAAELKRLDTEPELMGKLTQGAATAIARKGLLWTNNARRVCEAVQRKGGS